MPTFAYTEDAFVMIPLPKDRTSGAVETDLTKVSLDLYDAKHATVVSLVALSAYNTTYHTDYVTTYGGTGEAAQVVGDTCRLWVPRSLQTSMVLGSWMANLSRNVSRSTYTEAAGTWIWQGAVVDAIASIVGGTAGTGLYKLLTGDATDTSGGLYKILNLSSSVLNTLLQAVKLHADYVPSTFTADLADIKLHADYIPSTLTADLADVKAQVDLLPASPASTGDVTGAVAGLATTGDLAAAIAPLATAGDVTSAVTGLATSADVTAATSPLATAANLADVKTQVDYIPSTFTADLADIKLHADYIPASPVANSDLDAAVANIEGYIDGALGPIATTAQLGSLATPGDITMAANALDYHLDTIEGTMATAAALNTANVALIAVKGVTDAVGVALGDLVNDTHNAAVDASGIHTTVNAMASDVSGLTSDMGVVRNDLEGIGGVQSSLIAIKAATDALPTVLGDMGGSSVAGKLNAIKAELDDTAADASAAAAGVADIQSGLPAMGTAVENLASSVSALPSEVAGLTSTMNGVATNVTAIRAVTDTVPNNLPHDLGDKLNELQEGQQGLEFVAFGGYVPDLTDPLNVLMTILDPETNAPRATFTIKAANNTAVPGTALLRRSKITRL